MSTETDKVMSDVLVSAQWTNDARVRPDEHAGNSVPSVESPLHHVNFPEIANKGINDATVTLTELPVAGLLTLRAQADNQPMQNAIQNVLGLSLPGKLQATSAENGVCIRWMAPDEWLLSCAIADAFGIEQKLREETNSEGLAIVNVSGGYCQLILSGANANNVLKKSVAYDVHPSSLSIGKVVNTIFAKTQATIQCLDDNVYELIIRRSFADYVWLWLQNASREYGLAIATAS